MLQKIIHRLLRHRHFWRETSFDELSELYISMMFRGLSLSLTGIFVPVYMLHLGFSLTAILLVMAWYFTFRVIIFDWLAAVITAKLGPKHTMLIGYCCLIVSSLLFLTLPQLHWPVWVLGGVWGASAGLFFIPFHVDFSKVKHPEHGGKELGFLTIMERIGSIIGPVVGGIVATIFGAQYIFLVSVILLIIGVFPLFRTGEPVRTNQKLNFNGLHVKDLKRDFISITGLGVENTLSLNLWPMFLGSFVLLGSSVYAQLGLISSVSFVVSILAAHTIGQLIDNKKGRKLLRTSASINALIHLFRPFVTSLPLALGVNMANEAVTPGYRMPYVKGLYDSADDLPGYRIVYITSMELIASIAKASAWWLLAALTLVFSDRTVINIGFVIAASASCVIMTERFRALKPGI